MDFKKCDRCGSFFCSTDNICCNCLNKDSFEQSKLKSYFEESDSSGSIEDISYKTGIAVKNLNRFLSDSDFSEFVKEYGIDVSNSDSDGNISINL